MFTILAHNSDRLEGEVACLIFRRKEKEKEKTSAMIQPSPTSVAMESGDRLLIQPRQLQFPFGLEKQISCSLRLTNRYDFHLVFKVKTTAPKKYCVRPNLGVVSPYSTFVIGDMMMVHDRSVDGGDSIMCVVVGVERNPVALPYLFKTT